MFRGGNTKGSQRVLENYSRLSFAHSPMKTFVLYLLIFTSEISSPHPIFTPPPPAPGQTAQYSQYVLIYHNGEYLI